MRQKNKKQQTQHDTPVTPELPPLLQFLRRLSGWVLLLTFITVLLGLTFKFAQLSGGANGQVRKATVQVIADNGQRLGSGVLITSQGHILTAAHVVRGSEKESIAVRGPGLGRSTLTAEITQYLGTAQEPDPKQIGTDYALLKVNPLKTCPYLRIGDLTKVDEKTPCMVVGYPVDEQKSMKSIETLTLGEILAVLRDAEGEALAFNISAKIQPGMSGGPCTTREGHLIGLSILYSPGTGENLVVPLSRFRPVWEPLVK